MDKETKKNVSVLFVKDEDIEQLTYHIDDLQKENINIEVTPRRLARLGAKTRSSSKSENANQGGDGEDNAEVLTLINEELPEEYKEQVGNKPSDGLLHEEEETQFGFQTPKKRKGMTLKAQETVNRCYGTPSKDETPSKSRTEFKKSSDVSTPSTYKTPNKETCSVSTRKSRISFGGEMGATPSKSNILTGTPTKGLLKKTRRSILDDVSKTPSKREDSDGVTPVKHSKRFSSEEDLVRTPSRRQSVAVKSMKTIDEDTEYTPQTPYRMRQRTKAYIEAEQRKLRSQLDNESESEESELEVSSDDTDDEFRPLSDDESSKSEEESEGASETENSEDSGEGKSKHSKAGQKSTLTMIVKKDQPPVTPSRSRRSEVNYEFATESYFEKFGSKDITSNHTLNRLRNPRLAEDSLRKLLKELEISHKEPMAKLTDEHSTLFHRWLFTLQEGYNVLLYGLGSKRHLLQTFHDDMLSDSQVLVINGFFPGLTIKEIMDTILGGLLDVSDVPANPLEAIELIEKIQSSRRANTLYLLIHNLDGPTLRNNKAQTILSKLAKIPNVRVIASIDHINAPLMWDQTKLHRFNFTWWDVTTFMPYSAETSFESSLLIHQSGALQLSSLHSVFKSLTTNAKKIYMMIAKHQLENGGNSAYPGLPFSELYQLARHAFVVSSDTALRAQLTEFLDHHMVKRNMKRGGEESLVIPIDNAVIQQFVQSQEEKND